MKYYVYSYHIGVANSETNSQVIGEAWFKSSTPPSRLALQNATRNMKLIEGDDPVIVIISVRSYETLEEFEAYWGTDHA